MAEEKDWEVEGQRKQVEGKTHEFIGEMIGDTGRQVKGKIENLTGKIQEGLGQLGHKAEREADRMDDENRRV